MFQAFSDGQRRRGVSTNHPWPQVSRGGKPIERRALPHREFSMGQWYALNLLQSVETTGRLTDRVDFRKALIALGVVATRTEFNLFVKRLKDRGWVKEDEIYIEGEGETRLGLIVTPRGDDIRAQTFYWYHLVEFPRNVRARRQP